MNDIVRHSVPGLSRAKWVGCGVALLGLALLWWGQRPSETDVLGWLVWQNATTPRWLVALLAGSALGLSGGLMQLGLRNPLAAPETLGIQGGGLLALAVAVLWQPAWVAAAASWITFAGSLAAAGLVFGLAARRGYSPLSLLLGGMLVSLMSGSLLTLLMLRNDLALVSLMSLMAGSLEQDGWSQVQSLWLPVLLSIGLLIALAPRWHLLSLDDASLRHLGVNAIRLRLGVLVLGIYLASLVLGQVGLISFVALVAPWLVRAIGIRRPLPRLLMAAGIGGLLLLLCDRLLAWLPARDGQLWATGSLVALFAAPLLAGLVLSARFREPPAAETEMAPRSVAPWRLIGGLCLAVGLASGLALMVGQDASGWQWSANEMWMWRWPRALAAATAGAMLAAAGVLIQRLTANPLASPEVLGLSSSAGLGLLVLGLLVPSASHSSQWLVGGSAALGWLALLLCWGPTTAAGNLRLLVAGMTMTALFSASQNLLLGSGDPRGLRLLSWVAGSTYYVTPVEALGSIGLMLVLVLGAALLLRWLELFPLGSALVSSLGVPSRRSRWLVLVLASLLTVAATQLVGPVSFVGLLAPHLARQLGLRRAQHQLPGAVLIGVLVMLLADWSGRQWLFPDQIPAGVMASLLGGGYFVLCLLRTQRRRMA